MSITPLPPAPAITDTTSEFNTKAFNWVAALDPFTTEANALLSTCEDAAVTASAAIALVGAEAWISGTTYAIGDSVYSPIDMQTYKRKTNGAGTTDPSADATNWARVSLAEPANTITAIATGSLSDGNAVSLNSDGTVSVVSETLDSFGVRANITSSSAFLWSSTYDSTNNKIVVAYLNSAQSQGLAAVGTISGNTISFGTPVAFRSTGFTYEPSIVFDSLNGKVVISYSDENYYYYSIVGTVSGTSISFGTAVAFSSAVSTKLGTTYDSLNNKVVVFYVTSSTTSSKVGTVSGTSISFGSVVTISGNATSSCKAIFDSLNGKVIAIYTFNSSAGRVVVGTVSGTSISFGTPVNFQGSAIAEYSIAYDSVNSKVVITYNNSANSNFGTVVVGTVSGTSISFGTPVVFASAYVTYHSASFDPINNKMHIAYRNVANSNYGTEILGTVSGTSISFGTPIIFETSGTEYITTAYSSASDKVVVSYRSESTNFLYSKVNISYSTNASSFIGFSSASYTNGQTATISTVGSVINNQTGLTTKSKYYVQGNGTLSTTQNSFTQYAGIALSATNLLVKG